MPPLGSAIKSKVQGLALFFHAGMKKRIRGMKRKDPQNLVAIGNPSRILTLFHANVDNDVNCWQSQDMI